MATKILKGTVKFFDRVKGWGFITNLEDSNDYFFHKSGVNGTVESGNSVEFELAVGKKGPKAINIKLT